MNIYSCVDNTNIDKIICLFNSVWINSNELKKDNLNFYLLTDNSNIKLPLIPEYISKRLKISSLNLSNEWKNILNEFNSTFYQNSKWCKSDLNFARFLIFKHFPELDRVIYLDWDMIVQEDIFKLENEYNMKDKMVVASCGTQTIYKNIFKREIRWISNYNLLFTHDIKLRNKLKYGTKILKNIMENELKSHSIKGFNAGFYIISNYHFEEVYLKKLLKKLIETQKKENCFNFGTQVVMNLMHVDNRHTISKNWNTLPTDDCKGINIVHWNGKNKPWKSTNLSKSDKIWFNYYEKVYPNHNFSYLKVNKKEELTEKKNRKKINQNLLKFLSR